MAFGASISCALFQSFSDALKHITDYFIGPNLLTNYLDDFMVIAVSKMVCNQRLRVFLEVCKEINCLVSLEKTEYATNRIVFLEVLLDGCTHTLSILEDKRCKALSLVSYAIKNKKVTIHFIQKLTGVLNFLNKVIVPGRTFTRRMYDKLKITDKNGQPLKQYHHVNLDPGFLKDCKVWKIFLENAQLCSLCRPFIDIEGKLYANTLNFYSDASAGLTHGGFGVVYRDRYLLGKWGPRFLNQEHPSIEFLELYALCAALLTWGHFPELWNSRIVIFCDNQSVLNMVNNLVSNCQQCMKLIRILSLDCIKNNRRVLVEYVKSKDNTLADPLSRGNLAEFWDLAPESMNREPDNLPEEITPVTKIWFNSNL